MPITPFVFVSSKPTLIPSIIFAILFLLASCVHLYRIIQTRRRVYVLFFTFGFLRTVLFIIRIVWSQNLDSTNLELSSGIFTSGAFFIIVLAIYTLLSDWILTLANTSRITISENTVHRSTKLSKYEQFTLNVFEFLLPAFSILFVVGSIQEFDSDSNTLEDSLPETEKGFTMMKFAMICFLVSTILYMISVTYFALKYSNRPIHLQLKVFILYILGALLLIELVYGTFMIFAPSTDKINNYSWIFYVFEPLPEILILTILGGVILGEWFFLEDEIEQVESIKTVSIGSIGNGNTYV